VSSSWCVDGTAYIGDDPRVRSTLRLIDRVAPTPATILIVGETGTGKEMVARMIHARSPRALQPFLAVNCGAIADTLVESELFGHVRGAFTGATARRAGKFEAANHGTVFLDEVTSTSPSMQAALLRVLQSGEYCPVGATTPLHCDVRIVAAAGPDLTTLVGSGDFRADLFYRLNIIRVELPPLRERLNDLPLLVAHILRSHPVCQGRRLDAPSLDLLRAYDFPGNVRELESILQRAALLADGPVISVDGLLDPMSVATPERSDRTPADGEDFHSAKARVVERFERAFLASALNRSRGVIIDAARASGLSERNFHVKLRKYGLARGEPTDDVISPTDAEVRK
jgi:two-component system, NtrC family, response regulator